MESSQNEKIYNRFTTHFAYMLVCCFFLCKWLVFFPQRTALSPTKSLLMTIVHNSEHV